MEKILNKRKVRGVRKYSVCWKRFMVENDTWKKKENLENTKKLVDKFERRINAEIRRQEVLGRVGKVKLNSRIEEVRRSKLPVRYIVKLLFR